MKKKQKKLVTQSMTASRGTWFAVGSITKMVAHRPKEPGPKLVELVYPNVILHEQG